jgi:hypothetical protein
METFSLDQEISLPSSKAYLTLALSAFEAFDALLFVY